MTAEAVAILPQTFLARVPPDVARSIVDAGKLHVVPAGRLLRHAPRAPGVAIVLDGLVRVFLRSSAERQVTVRYARPGETLGLAHLFGAQPEVHSQAVTDVKLWLLSRKGVRELAERTPSLAVAIAEECAARVADAVEELALLTFGSVRQHVARHLLDLSSAECPGAALVVRVSHQELADATGSVREVVARVLKELDTRGLVRRVSGGIVVVDATRLDLEVRGKPS